MRSPSCRARSAICRSATGPCGSRRPHAVWRPITSDERSGMSEASTTRARLSTAATASAGPSRPRRCRRASRMPRGTPGAGRAGPATGGAVSRAKPRALVAEQARPRKVEWSSFSDPVVRSPEESARARCVRYSTAQRTAAVDPLFPARAGEVQGEARRNAGCAKERGARPACGWTTTSVEPPSIGPPAQETTEYDDRSSLAASWRHRAAVGRSLSAG